MAGLAELFGRFLMLSLLSIGGAITVAPEMHRLVVAERGWLDDADFTASISLAQAAPGPNILFVTLIGWHAAGAAGALAATLGILLPSSLLVLAAFRWTERYRAHRGVQAFRAGMAPITLGLLLATGWILAGSTLGDPVLALVTVATAVLAWKTRLNPLWMLAAGALAGTLRAG
nr:chromate transporter [Quisquiliibacterium transsilvanicum]